MVILDSLLLLIVIKPITLPISRKRTITLVNRTLDKPRAAPKLVGALQVPPASITPAVMGRGGRSKKPTKKVRDARQDSFLLESQDRG